MSNPVTDRMLAFLRSYPKASVLDVGAAFGVATLPALRTGAIVIANDVEPAHLDHIKQIAEAEALDGHLRIVLGRFPAISPLNGLDAVHCSNVLHFLRGAELLQAAEFARRALSPGGRLFIQVGTPYAGHIRSFLPTYLTRIASRARWPGEIENARAIVPNSVRADMPTFFHALDREVLERVLCQSGFRVEYAEYYTRPGLPEVCKNDGRENLGLIAVLDR